MGVNSLAFRLPQHNRFFTLDADCVPCTPQTPWELNRRFLDLVAGQGPRCSSPSIRPRAPSRPIAILATVYGWRSVVATPVGIEPVDWLVNTTPNVWRAGAGTVRYDWARPWGADPAGGAELRTGGVVTEPPAVVRRGTNLDRVGGFNDTVVLDAIRRAEQRLSRVEIAAATGLSGQAISNITRRLLDAGLVREAGREKEHRPRQTPHAARTRAHRPVRRGRAPRPGRRHGRHARPDRPGGRAAAGGDPSLRRSGRADRRDRGDGRGRHRRSRRTARTGGRRRDRGARPDRRRARCRGRSAEPHRLAPGPAARCPARADRPAVLLDKDVTAAASAEKWAGGRTDAAASFSSTSVPVSARGW